jgi:signal transduction histidine kinase/predicted RNA-binding protein with RPS1 domain/ActR/RegA family two-component response regulator
MSSTDPILFLNNKRYRRGQTVDAEVKGVFPFGLLIELTDGNSGVIRKYEISWNETLSDEELSQRFPVGSKISPVVLKADQERESLVLSLRRARYDPWDRIEKRRDELIGSVVRGVVEDLKPYGAFVELQDPPGAVGLVHISRIPGGEDSSISDLLWIGDCVEAVVAKIELGARRIGLDINRRLTRERVAEETPAEKSERHLPLEEDSYEELDEIDDGTEGIVVRRRGIIKRILVIDDNEGFIESLCDELQAAGYSVDSVLDGESGCEKAISKEYDLILLDVDLGHTLGTNVAQEILRSRPEAYIILITAFDWRVSDEFDLGEMDLVGVVPKPDYHSEISRLLQALEDGERPSTLHRFSEQEKEKSFDEIRGLAKPGSVAGRLNPLLEEMISETESDSGFVFRLDLIKHSVSIVAQGGNVSFNEYAMTDLWHSPVKDAAVECKSVVAKDAKFDSQAEFRYLLEFVDFDSCVGFPIAVEEQGFRYALFLFSSKSFHFSKPRKQKTFLATRVAEQLLREGLMELWLREQQKLMLAGEMSFGHTHEINNKILGLERYVKLIKVRFEKARKDPELYSDKSFQKELEKSIQTSLDISRYLRTTSNIYLDLARKEKEGNIDVNQIIRELAHLVAVGARKRGGEVYLNLDDDLPTIQSIKLRLEQIILNLMLNAVQLLDESSLRSRKPRLLVTSEYDSQDSELPVKIRFIDDGPGIHRQRFDWVFEMGTSTRKDGTGLGLFISKGLAESLGGRLTIEDSVMFVGSTFLVELPTTIPEETAK